MPGRPNQRGRDFSLLAGSFYIEPRQQQDPLLEAPEDTIDHMLTESLLKVPKQREEP